MGVHETGNDDPVSRIDEGGRVVGDRDVGTDFADFAVLDQHIRLREVADFLVEGEHDGVLEDDAARALHASQLGVGRAGGLRGGTARLRLRGDPAKCDRGTRFEQIAP